MWPYSSAHLHLSAQLLNLALHVRSRGLCFCCQRNDGVLLGCKLSMVLLSCCSDLQHPRSRAPSGLADQSWSTVHLAVQGSQALLTGCRPQSNSRPTLLLASTTEQSIPRSGVGRLKPNDKLRALPLCSTDFTWPPFKQVSQMSIIQCFLHLRNTAAPQQAKVVPYSISQPTCCKNSAPAQAA